MLHIDIETRSDVDLTKLGVHRYTESPGFSVLLIAFAYDDGPVEIVDLAQGEELPKSLLRDLIDPRVPKAAFNASFERVCLDRHLGLKTGPWHCSMVQANALGLRGSLDTIGFALNLSPDEQKLKTGKNLIRLFSLHRQPSSKNGYRTIYEPEDRPFEWAMFKDYCCRDVEAERAIFHKLSDFPLPPKEQELYALDQKINDRGVCIDLDLASSATKINDELYQHYEEDFYALTGIDTPSRLALFKDWIKKVTGTEVKSITKGNLPILREQFEDYPNVVQALDIRELLSRTSVKKYEAMETLAGEDCRARGLFRFYGASTGRWCLTGDHEVLTPGGWVRLDEWKGGQIAVWNTQEQISFQTAKALAFDYSGDMVHFQSQRINQIATPDHTMPVWGKSGWENKTIAQMLAAKSRWKLAFTGKKNPSESLNNDELRVLIMTQADGCYTESSLRFRFKKLRKVERCKTLLRRVGVRFTQQENSDDSKVIVIRKKDLPLWLRMFENKTFGWWLLNESADVIFDELEYWDAYRCGPNSIQYSTVNRQNAEIIQACAVLSGRTATLLSKARSKDNWKTAYIVNIWNTPGAYHDFRQQPTTVKYTGKVYCAETSTGYFMTRRNGTVWVTGNSGRGIQPQNLPQNHLSDLDTARALIRQQDLESVEMLYDDPADVLSQLIRTAIVPSKGKKFLVADFSAIEARVIAWLAGETWRLDVFNSHGKIYEASASHMFGVPIEQITKGSDLRQKGKIAELALGYGGGVGALRQMGALDMGLDNQELQPLVNSWRLSNPKIVQLWFDVETMVTNCLTSGHPQKLNDYISCRYDKSILFIRLPNGRELAYPKAQLRPHQKFEGRTEITYQELVRGDWSVKGTYGGRLVENIVQATARDCLAEKMLALNSKGYDIVLHVHDEVVIEVDPDGAEQQLQYVLKAMSEPLAWAPELPLNADGFICDYYQKD